MRRLAVLLAALAVAVLVAGCSGARTGGGGNGPGYSGNVSDLLVKIPALQSDPCRGAQADQLYRTCGRYVTEVANTVNTLRADVQGHKAQVDALAKAVHTYQSMGCDTIAGQPSQAQRTRCPQALRTIGGELDQLGNSLGGGPSR